MLRRKYNPTFKALLVLLLVVLISFMIFTFIIGCGGTETKEKTSYQSYETEKGTTTSNPAPQPQPTPKPQPTGIPWDQAKYHIGERTTVYGPVVSTKWATSSKGQPTFINLGNAYPNQNRFQAIIWVQNRGNFSFAPESYYSGKTISVTGLIVDYEGVPEIEVTSPSQIQVW